MHPSPVSPTRAGTLVLSADDPDLVALTNRLSGGGRTVMLGGTMSRNVHLVDAALVLRVHAPSVSPARVRAERRLRHVLLDAGLTAAKPRSVTGEDLLWVAGRVAEVEQYVPHGAPVPTRGGPASTISLTPPRGSCWAPMTLAHRRPTPWTRSSTASARKPRTSRTPTHTWTSPVCATCSRPPVRSWRGRGYSSDTHAQAADRSPDLRTLL